MSKEIREHKHRYIPESLHRINAWKLSRRKFMGGLLAGGITATLPVFSVSGKMYKDIDILSKSQLAIVTSIQKILFPSDGNGPGAYDVMADKYLVWVLSDKRMDPEEKEYIINGIGWIDETSMEIYSNNYINLSQNEKEKLVADVAKESWGSSWLSVMLTFIFEALLCDPQYGYNTEEIGWNWLQYKPGYPRPTAKLLYPEILTTVSNNSES